MSKPKLTFEVSEEVKRQFMASVALRGRTVKSVLTDAARHWFPLLDAARTATVTGETEALAEIVKEIDDA